jgi:transketolase
MPSWELFEAEGSDYKETLLGGNVPILSVEAGVTLGWARYAHASLGIDRFGSSGPAKAVFAHLGLTVEAVVKKSRALLTFFATHPVPPVAALLPSF